MLTFCCCFATRFVGTFYEFANERLPCIMYCESPFISKNSEMEGFFKMRWVMRKKKKRLIILFDEWPRLKMNLGWLTIDLLFYEKPILLFKQQKLQTNYIQRLMIIFFFFTTKDKKWLGTVWNLILTDFSHD